MTAFMSAQQQQKLFHLTQDDSSSIWKDRELGSFVSDDTRIRFATQKGMKLQQELLETRKHYNESMERLDTKQQQILQAVADLERLKASGQSAIAESLKKVKRAEIKIRRETKLISDTDDKIEELKERIRQSEIELERYQTENKKYAFMSVYLNNIIDDNSNDFNEIQHILDRYSVLKTLKEGFLVDLERNSAEFSLLHQKFTDTVQKSETLNLQSTGIISKVRKTLERVHEKSIKNQIKNAGAQRITKQNIKKFGNLGFSLNHLAQRILGERSNFLKEFYRDSTKKIGSLMNVVEGITYGAAKVNCDILLQNAHFFFTILNLVKEIEENDLMTK
ncbi:hypothetical protein PCE1_002650 [Barthelona sp. PCE]